VGQNTYWSGSDVFSKRLLNELPDKIVSDHLCEVTFVEDHIDVLNRDLSEALNLLAVDPKLHGSSLLYFPASLELLLVVGILLLERCVPGFCLVVGGIDLLILF
jgi:hypothetical protein